MPELPEVETTCRGIAPHLCGRKISRVLIRQRQLRWPIPATVTRYLTGARVESVTRRAKYVLINSNQGTALLHLGMTGSLRVVPLSLEPRKHDHVEMQLDNKRCLRFNDPRRFGALLWAGKAPQEHPLLASLGPEPLAVGFDGACYETGVKDVGDELAGFDGQWLYRRSRGRRSSVKAFIMDASNVVGVGNIYASEALFRAGIHPRRAAGRISLARYQDLVVHIREVLSEAIAAGGTTLRNFSSDGNPGYFTQDLRVYGRKGLACLNCAAPIRAEVIAQRASFFCPRCQK